MKEIKHIQTDLNDLNTSFEVSKIANQSSDLNTLLSNLSDFISKKLNSERIIFYAIENGAFKIVTTIQNPVADEYFEYEDNEALWATIKTGKVIKTTDDKDKLLYKYFWNNLGPQKINAKYLRAFFDKEMPLCFCFVGVDEKDSELDDTKIEFLNKVFDFMEPVIIKYIDRRNKDSKIVELQKSLYNISILYNISQAVNFIDDLKRLLSVILSKALNTLEAEKGSLMLYDYSDNTLQVKVVYGLVDKQTQEDINNGFIECAKIKAGEGVAGTVFLEKKAIITNLGSADPRFIKKNSLTNTQSLLCVPLIVKGEAIGVINISNKMHDKLFNQKDLDFMISLANQAAIAIDNAKLYELATKDGLTKLYIYRHFYTLLENEMRRCARYRHNMSLLMIDIDDFKKINDKYGHLAGDQILREISNQISDTIRKIDTPARYGGEEFAIILPETASGEASIIAERIRKKIAETKVLLQNNNLMIGVSVSLGVAQYDFKDTDPKVLIGNADKALYFSKNHGKNLVSIYEEEGCHKADFSE